MAYSWKAMDLNKFVVKDDMIDYVLHKYGSNWQVHDVIADDILDDLLKKEWEKQKRVKYDKRKVTQMKIHDFLEKRIEKFGQHLNKEKQIMDINKEKEKMVMERATFDESSDHDPFQATSDESSNHNPFQATSDESSDDTLKSSSEDTCSSDCSWEQKKASKGKPWSRSTQAEKKLLMVNKGQALQKQKKLLLNQRLYSGLTKRSPPVTNCVLGLAAVTTWQQILNKEFGIKISKEDVRGSSNVRRKDKRKML
ncbi:hypothetical protein Tco_1109852 [Tanacetum coccineum]|uniref:Uncharacterized protein n=1 Tax=Tanacetum coccineum TaxID=301880 RepID=A0ABQ5IH70_9ASTR